MTPEELVGWLFSQTHTVTAVRELDDAQIIAVRGHLARDFDENGLTGMLLGIVLRDEVRRFEDVVAARPAAPEFPENPNWDTQDS